MIISSACNYALRSVLYLAARKERALIHISEIAESLNVPFHFLTKIFQTLTTNGITRSYRGPRGGISLIKPVDRIMLADIILIIDGPRVMDDCFLGLAQCTGSNKCPLNYKCKRIRLGLGALLENVTVATLARRAGDIDILDRLFGPNPMYSPMMKARGTFSPRREILPRAPARQRR